MNKIKPKIGNTLPIIAKVKGSTPESTKAMSAPSDAIAPLGFDFYNPVHLAIPQIKLEKSKKNGFTHLSIKGSQSLPIRENVSNAIKLDQFVAGGSLGIKTSTQRTIVSSGFWQCAGLAVFDKKTGMQALMHVFCDTSSTDSIKKALLKMFPKEAFQEPDRLKLSLVNGSDSETKKSIRKILASIYKINPESAQKVQFYHFPTIEHNYFCIQNGEVFSADWLGKKAVNPKKTIYF